MKKEIKFVHTYIDKNRCPMPPKIISDECCPNCGEHLIIDTQTCLTSMPPRYRVYCEKCNHEDSIFCRDISLHSGEMKEVEIPDEDEQIAAALEACNDEFLMLDADNKEDVTIGDTLNLPGYKLHPNIKYIYIGGKLFEKVNDSYED